MAVHKRDEDMIDNLTKKRRKLIADMEENDYHANKLIADLYSDPSHFIFEIIQNAEDAKATKIKYRVLTDRLIIEHNGNLFNVKDINAITTIGSSPKKDDVNKIGKFGAGFKAVFAITNAPEIHSGDYHFKIVDFIVPEKIDDIKLDNGLTQIILPFKNNIDSDIETIITLKLQNLDMETLLFLSNINEIEWQTNDSFGHYIKDVIKENEYNKVYIVSEKNEEEYSQEYFVVDAYVPIKEKNLKISVAYNMSNNQIVKSNQPYLSVYFPTKEKTNLNFILNAPYKTTPNRETIPFEDEENRILTERLAKLVSDSLGIIQNNNLFDVDFLSMLPLEKIEHNELYSKIYDDVKNRLMSNTLIPTHDGLLGKAEDLLLARGKELVSLLDSNDLGFLWNKKNWIHTNITVDRTKILRDYLVHELDIKEIDYEDFARILNYGFLSSKTDGWMNEFYSSLLNQEALFRDTHRKKGILRHKRIVRLENNELVALYDDFGSVQVYRSGKESTEFKTVKKVFFDDEQAKEFFEKYNVSYPDRISELKEFIAPKYTEEDVNIDFQEYEKDMKKIIDIYKSTQGDVIVNLFKDKYIVMIENGNFELAENSYIPASDLKLWFNKNDNVNFIHKDIYCDENRGFFEQLGSNMIPKRLSFNMSLSPRDKQKLRKKRNFYRGTSYSSEDPIIDYMIDGLEENIDIMILKQSVLLWKYLLEYDKKYSNWKYKFYESVYSWNYYEPLSIPFNANFIQMLKLNNWIFDKNSNLVRPEDITIEEIHDDYKKDIENIEVLEKVFNFKLDEVKQLEEKTGGKLLLGEELKEFEEYKREKEKEKENEPGNSDEDWKPDIDPDDVDIDDIDIVIETDILETDDLSGQDGGEEINTGSQDPDPGGGNPKPKPKPTSTTSNIPIGEWGEKFVHKILLNTYREEKNFSVRWLNESGTGKGYDFVVEQDGEELYYIEVKSKVDEKPTMVKITGTQWEWARKLHNEKKGDRFQIYIVSNAGKENAKIRVIKNPIQKWKSGYIKAHPVDLEL